MIKKWGKENSPSVGAPVSVDSVSGGWQLFELSRPEPTVNVEGLQVGTVASLEVAQSTGRPDVLDIV